MKKKQSLFNKVEDKLRSTLQSKSRKPLTSRKKQGNKAEDEAHQYLLTQGYQLIERNFSTKAGEIDLIMQDGESTVFIEVRYRKNADFGGAAESVTPKKQQRIIKAALAYSQRYAPQSSLRFDVIAIEGDNRTLNHIISAFGN
ncbi:MAG: YraN family protein [Cocleimonas sp.]